MGRYLSITNFLLGPILHPGVGIMVGGVSREQGASFLAYSRPYPRGIGWRMEIHIPSRIFWWKLFCGGRLPGVLRRSRRVCRRGDIVSVAVPLSSNSPPCDLIHTLYILIVCEACFS